MHPFTVILSVLLLGAGLKRPEPVSATIVPCAPTDFNPVGYYFVRPAFRHEGHAIDWVFMNSEDENPCANLHVSRSTRNRKSTWFDVKAKKATIGLQKTVLVFEHPVLGKVTIQGKFTGKQGPWLDNASIETVVFAGTLEHKGKTIPIEMTWFEGD